MTSLVLNGRVMKPYCCMEFLDEEPTAPAEAEPVDEISNMTPM